MAMDHLKQFTSLQAAPRDPERFVLICGYARGKVKTSFHELETCLSKLWKIGDSNIAKAIEASRCPGVLIMLAVADDGWRVMTASWSA
jgi:hypothetical protein